MNQKTRAIFLGIFFISLISIVSAIDIDSCQEISSPGTYVLLSDINTTSTCFEINSDDVTIDGNGHKISGDNGGRDYGVYVDRKNNIEIKNLKIESFNTGIKIRASNKVSLVGNDLILNVNGIHLTTTENSTIMENSILMNDNGLYLSVSNSNKIISNSIHSNTNNGVIFSTSNYNEFSGNWVTNNPMGIYLIGSTNNIFKNSRLSNDDEVNLLASSSGNTFLNDSYDSDSEEVEAASKLIRKWNFQIKVTDGNGSALEDSTITIWNSQGDLISKVKTDSEGNIENQEIVEYVNNGRRKIYYSPYSVHVSAPGHSQNSFVLEIKDNQDILVVLDKIIPPSNTTISNIVTSPALPLVNNGSSQDILVSFDTHNLPFDLRFKLYDHDANLIDTTSQTYIDNSSNSSLTYSISDSLLNGQYVIILETLRTIVTSTEIFNQTTNQTSNETTTSLITNTYEVGSFFVNEFVGNLPSITDLSTSPAFPFSSNGQNQTILVDFTTGDNAILVVFEIYGEAGLASSSSPITVNNNSDLPIRYTIPSLPEGEYNISLIASDFFGNTNTLFLGDFIINYSITNNPSPNGDNSTNQTNNPPTTTTSSGGGGGGGGGGSRLTSLTTPDQRTPTLGNNANETAINGTIGFENVDNEDKNNQTGFNRITGAIIGALGGATFWIALVFILFVVAVYVFVRHRINSKKTPTKTE